MGDEMIVGLHMQCPLF